MAKKLTNKKLWLIVLFIIFINTLITLLILYAYNAAAISPAFETITEDNLLKRDDLFNYELPIDARAFKQYLPEMRLQFDYSEPMDSLTYSYSNEHSYEGDNYKEAIKGTATIGEKYFMPDSSGSFEERVDAINICNRLYTLTSDANSLKSKGLAEEYKHFKSIKLGDNKTLHIFKLKKSCEGIANISPDQYENIERILSSAKLY